MSLRENTFVAVAPLRSDADVPALRKRMEAWHDAMERGESPGSFRSMARLHSARLLLAPADENGGPPSLVFSAVFDGDAGVFFGELAGQVARELLPFLSECEGGPPADSGAAAVERFLRDRAVRRRVFHIGAVDTTVAEVREEAHLRDAIQEFVDDRRRAGAWRHGDPVRIHADILAHVRASEGLPKGVRPGPPFAERLRRWADLLGLIALVLGPFAALAAVLWRWLVGPQWWWLAAAVGGPLLAAVGFGVGLLAVRFQEWREGPPAEPGPAASEGIGSVLYLEDRHVQNQISLVLPAKAGWFRAFTLRATLAAAHAFSCHFWNRGRLVGVPTIHFARFFLLDGGRRLMFLSHYDGSWERYLGEFLTVGAFAVVPIWGNLRGCPETRFLVRTTPGFGRKFLPYTRRHQVVTEVWYAAYPDLSLTNILRNAEIRRGLFRSEGRAACLAWLALL